MFSTLPMSRPGKLSYSPLSSRSLRPPGLRARLQWERSPSTQAKSIEGLFPSLLLIRAFYVVSAWGPQVAGYLGFFEEGRGVWGIQKQLGLASTPHR